MQDYYCSDCGEEISHGIRKFSITLTSDSVGNFSVKFLDPAKVFIDNLDVKTREKVLFNIWRSQEINDPRLLKKLNNA